MRTIYQAIAAHLKTELPSLRWIDWDKGQLKAKERPPVAFPCALIGIHIAQAKDITPTIQHCDAIVRIKLGFDQPMKTEAHTPPAHLNKALEPYDLIADAYKALQGFNTPNFDPLTRVKQMEETNSHGLFTYIIDFRTEFEDNTAI